MQDEIVRVRKEGAGLVAHLPKAIVASLKLNRGDYLLLRIAGEKLLVERVPVERLARFSLAPVAGGSR